MCNTKANDTHLLTTQQIFELKQPEICVASTLRTKRNLTLVSVILPTLSLVKYFTQALKI